MNLDLLDESYPMVKSKLPFEDFVHGGLTAPTRRSNHVAQTCQFWVSTYAPPVLWQSLRARKHSQWSKLAKDDD
jgi:hypothetical protein